MGAVKSNRVTGVLPTTTTDEFMDSDLSDTDNIVPFKNTTPIQQPKKGKIKERRAN